MLIARVYDILCLPCDGCMRHDSGKTRPMLGTAIIIVQSGRLELHRCFTRRILLQPSRHLPSSHLDNLIILIP